MEITALSATEIADRIRDGEVSSREVVNAFIRRIETVDPDINALVLPRFGEARREADEADAARRRGERLGALHGVPVTIKDQFHVRGLPTTWGLARLTDRTVERDGPMVAARPRSWPRTARRSAWVATSAAACACRRRGAASGR